MLYRDQYCDIHVNNNGTTQGFVSIVTLLSISSHVLFENMMQTL